MLAQEGRDGAEKGRPLGEKREERREKREERDQHDQYERVEVRNDAALGGMAQKRVGP